MYTIQWVSSTGVSGITNKIYIDESRVKQLVDKFNKERPHINHRCIVLGRIPDGPAVYSPPLEVPPSVESPPPPEDVETEEYYNRKTGLTPSTTVSPSSSCSVSSVSSMSEEEDIEIQVE